MAAAPSGDGAREILVQIRKNRSWQVVLEILCEPGGRVFEVETTVDDANTILTQLLEQLVAVDQEFPVIHGK